MAFAPWDCDGGLPRQVCLNACGFLAPKQPQSKQMSMHDLSSNKTLCITCLDPMATFSAKSLRTLFGVDGAVRLLP